MPLNIGVYGSADAAERISERLAKAGFDEQRALIADRLSGQEEAAVQSAVEAGLLPSTHIDTYTQALREGRSLVTVRPPFGSGRSAVLILEDEGGVVEDHAEVRAIGTSGSPLSDLLGMSTLVDWRPLTELKDSSWTFSSLFGWALLSREPAPLSARFRWKTILAPKRPWEKSLGFPLLSGNPAPLSSLFRWRTISAPKRPWEKSLGFSLLSQNPAPLSSALGLPVLTGDRSSNRG